MVTTSFRGKVAGLSMPTIIQDPFPGLLILNHQAFTDPFVLGRINVFENTFPSLGFFQVLEVNLNLGFTLYLSRRSTHSLVA
jgi:hypothetical protein